uniref:Reverse transcriptase domain-containing protein n=1 Tax=Helianthus annuus TaxID=4232 RepID=A0A251U2H0_HELAN
MPFGLYNAPATFQRCMMSIFSDMVGESLEIFMDDFSRVKSNEVSVRGQNRYKMQSRGLKDFFWSKMVKLTKPQRPKE